MLTAASWILTACGTIVVLIGVFFVFFRPSLLPEDARFMKSSIDAISRTLPELSSWLRHVFWVLGGYIATTGVLVVYVARTRIPSGDAGAIAILALALVTSIGWMTVVNFLIRSDFGPVKNFV